MCCNDNNVSPRGLFGLCIDDTLVIVILIVLFILWNNSSGWSNSGCGCGCGVTARTNNCCCG